MRSFVGTSISLLLFFVAGSLSAQHEYDVWYFGWGYGLDFRGGSTPIIQNNGPAIFQIEGSASICNRRTGAPLFYTDGITVWDRSDMPMPNGTGLLGHISSTQSALIVPIPCDTNRYYIFTADQQGYVWNAPVVNGINYSIVDMRLNGGLGDVTAKNIPLQNPASERLVAVAHTNGYDYWVITHSTAGQTFYAWHVDGAGVAGSPMTSLVGIDKGAAVGFALWTIGYLKASPNGQKLAMADQWNGTVELFDFNASTGVVTNGIIVRPEGPGFGGSQSYGISFSPDNSKLYYSSLGVLTQANLVPYNTASILASRTAITSTTLPTPSGILGAMQIGPDGKIYVLPDVPWIGVVNNPNAAGNACNYSESAMQVTNRGGWAGFPNNIDARASARIDTSGPTTICQGDSVVLSGDSGFVKYEWSTGETSRSIVVRTSGTYMVVMTDSRGCIRRAQMSVVVNPLPAPSITPQGPTRFCEGDSVLLQVDQSYRSYRWSNGVTGRVVAARTNGRYAVLVTDSNGCSATASIDVIVDSIPRPVITGGGIICFGDSTTLDAGSGYAGYRWSTGDSTEEIRLTGSGTYSVTVTNANGCSGRSPTVEVTMKGPIVPTLSPAGRIDLCQGDSVRLDATPGFARYQWSTGDTSSGIVVRTSNSYSVTVFDSDGCSGNSATTIVVVHPLPPKPTISGAADTLRSTPAVAWQWTYNHQPIAGGTREWIIGREPGLYTVRITDSNGCSAESDPYRILRFHALMLDTISLHVGEEGYLTMHIVPPIEKYEMLQGYRVVLGYRSSSLFFHDIISPDRTVAGERATIRHSAPNLVVVERDIASPSISGGDLFRIKLEGLSTGVPLNVVSIDSAALIGSDSIAIGGNGLVLLRGCDIARGFGFGTKVRIASVAPNPAGSATRVYYHAPEGIASSLVLVDLAGSDVIDWDLPEGSDGIAETELDIRSIPSGIYLLQIRSGNEYGSAPFVIIR